MPQDASPGVRLWSICSLETNYRIPI
ncbi:MAG: hypothetical protein QOI94_3371, partial [Acidobacteriaceae bacterium]|nr:hypothetical protein [Acidobacteriaceae bacterium]